MVTHGILVLHPVKKRVGGIVGRNLKIEDVGLGVFYSGGLKSGCIPGALLFEFQIEEVVVVECYYQ